jgi:CheY-like chemotaxis protein/type II secretory pathway pseudopilin PulG
MLQKNYLCFIDEKKVSIIMDNILIEGIVAIVVVGGAITVVLKNMAGKKKAKAKEDQLAQSIKDKLNKDNERLKTSSAHDLISKGSGAAKGGGGIVSQKPTTLEKEKVKAANWTESESYEEDIKKIDIDNLFKDNEPLIVQEQPEKEEKEKSSLSSKAPQELKFNPAKNEDKPIVTMEVKPQVLLVDDSMVVRKYVGDLLKKHGYDIVMKTDGWEAITYLNSTVQKPELIISDIEMPNMNGFQLIEAIRKERKFNNVPVLVISAHAESHLKLMESENIQGFIKKPFEDKDLLSQISYLLNHQ